MFDIFFHKNVNLETLCKFYETTSYITITNQKKQMTDIFLSKSSAFISNLVMHPLNQITLYLKLGLHQLKYTKHLRVQ